MKKKFFVAFIIACTFILSIGIINASAEKYGDLTYSISNGEVTITDCIVTVTSVEIPSGIDGIPVTSIGDCAFEYCSSLTRVTIPDSVISIGNSAFEYCSSLTSVTIPDSVISIGTYAFSNCTGLTSIEIPDSVTSIGSYTFYGCSILTSITIPDSVTSVGNSAFEDCSSLRSIAIPGSVTSIGTCVFNNTAYYYNTDNWSNGALYIGNHLIRVEGNLLGSFVIKAGTKTIAGEAFCYCESLTSITIPNSVISIGSYAFEGCSSLTGIIIPDSVTSIGIYAFRRCSGLTSITIPDSVTSVGNSAFEDCSSLTRVTIPDSVTSIGSNLFYKTAYYNNSDNWDNGVLYVGNHLIQAKGNLLGSYIIKEGTKTIAGNAFYYCRSLTSITIPDSVTSIGNYAFEKCSSLTSITMPDSVTSIGIFAFSDCSSLTSITIPDSVTSIEYGTFFRCIGLANVYYNGTADMWNSIYIGTFNDALINATRIYESFVADIEKTEKGYSFDIRLIEGNIDSFETATLTVALYDNNRMLLDLVRVPVTSGTSTLEPTVETNKTPDYAKIMLWGGENIFNPLCIAKEIPIK